MKKIVCLCFTMLSIVACKKVEKNNTTPEPVISDSLVFDTEKPIQIKTKKQIKEELTAKGYKTYDYVDDTTKDTILMQQYFIVVLKNGTIRSQNEEEAVLLQQEHKAYIKKMQDLGYADISGAFEDHGALLRASIYNVPTLKMADSLAKADPLVKTGRLDVEIHPWWVEKGAALK